jgi:hypothetical protein
MMLGKPDLQVTSKKSGTTIKWNKKSNATGYEIYRADYYLSEYSASGNLWKTVGSSTTSLTDKTATSTKGYNFMVRAYAIKNGVKYYGDFSDVYNSAEPYAILNGATVKPKSSYTVYNGQVKPATSWTYTISSADKKILDKFAKKYFTSGMTRAEKLETTLNWIHYNVDYAYVDNGYWNQIVNKTWVDAIFTYKKGQCAQYNGAMAAMMAYLGYDVCVYQGWVGSTDTQHFWTEVKIEGITYIMETGNYKKNGDWMYFLSPKSEHSEYLTK